MSETLGKYVHIILCGTPDTMKIEYWDGNILWVTPKDMDYTRHIYKTQRTITEAGLNSSNAKLLDYGDIIISARGTVGKIIRCDQPMTCNQTCYAIRTKDAQKLNQDYLYYLMFKCLNYLLQNSSGSVFNTIIKSTLERVPISIPNLSQQHKIASILSAYDDLIENNNRRIQLLEQAAKLLYKEWFVAFRFPGHEHVKITDGFPEGWQKKMLGEIADITMGQSPKSVYYNDEGIGLPFHQGVSDFTNRFPVHKTYCTVSQRTAEPGDVLFSVRAPVGRINRTIDKIVIGRGLATIHSKDEKQSFLYYALSEKFFKDDLIGVGSIYAAITKKDLYDVTALHPPKKLIEIFSEYSEPIDTQIEMLHKSNMKLSQARDLLLPRLMNGEINI